MEDVENDNRLFLFIRNKSSNSFFIDGENRHILHQIISLLPAKG